MQVENRNAYNTLGRMGPMYPRPEYRPPQNFPMPLEDGKAGDAGKGTEGKGTEGKGKAPADSLILSPRLKRSSAPVASEITGKLNPLTAKSLVEETAGRISGLDPRSENGCPHRKPEGHGLLYPVYA
jgi:hypothetical protein